MQIAAPEVTAASASSRRCLHVYARQDQGMLPLGAHHLCNVSAAMVQEAGTDTQRRCVRWQHRASLTEELQLCRALRVCTTAVVLTSLFLPQDFKPWPYMQHEAVPW